MRECSLGPLFKMLGSRTHSGVEELSHTRAAPLPCRQGNNPGCNYFFFPFFQTLGAVFQNTVSLSLSIFLLFLFFKIFFNRPFMDVVCASFRTLIMRK